MNKNFNKTNAVLMVSLSFFIVLVGYTIFKEASGGGSSLNRADVIKFFSEKINEISPDKPESGGRWVVSRFRFVDKNDVYVEYGDGHMSRVFLLSLTKTVGSAPYYKIVGFFEPEPLGYKLLAGEDSFKDKPQEIYEYNQTVGQWVRVN